MSAAVAREVETVPVALDMPATIATRAATDELLKLARERALDPAVFDEFDPFFWRALISSGRLDSYFTLMAPSSLQNYAAEAGEGVPFMAGHDVRELPIGHSLTGTYVRKHNETPARVEADFYALRGVRLNSKVDPDQLINGMRAGVVRDVSIGFLPGRFICSICQRDMLTDWDCWHFPGVEYELRDDDGKKTGEKRLCWALVEDAHLAEVSAVYNGATPGAGIVKTYAMKAAREAGEGRLRPEIVRLLEARYRIALPTAARAVAVPLVPREGQVMSDTNERAPLIDALGDQVRAALTRMGAPEGAGIEWAEAELARLRPLADDGKRYREHLVAEALASGVRAYDTGFAKETYAALLANAPVETVIRMRDDWEALAKRALPGGRLTTETDETDKRGGEPAPTPAVPNAAYRT